MKLQDQVISLESAKRLKELGVAQISIFFWWTKGVKPIISHANKVGDMHNAIFDDEYAAFSVAELGEMLPRRNKYWSDKLPEEKWSNDYWAEISLCWNGQNEDGSMRNACYIQYVGDTETARVPDEPIYGTEAEARAKMLIYLIEQKLMVTIPCRQVYDK